MRIIGKPHFNPGLADKTLGSESFIPTSETERVRRELWVIPLEDIDFLVQVNVLERKDEAREIQRIPLGFAQNLDITNYFLFARVEGSVIPAEKEAPEIKNAYEKMDGYERPLQPKFLDRIKSLGPYV